MKKTKRLSMAPIGCRKLRACCGISFRGGGGAGGTIMEVSGLEGPTELCLLDTQPLSSLNDDVELLKTCGVMNCGGGARFGSDSLKPIFFADVPSKFLYFWRNSDILRIKSSASTLFLRLPATLPFVVNDGVLFGIGSVNAAYCLSSVLPTVCLLKAVGAMVRLACSTSPPTAKRGGRTPPILPPDLLLYSWRDCNKRPAGPPLHFVVLTTWGPKKTASKGPGDMLPRQLNLPLLIQAFEFLGALKCIENIKITVYQVDEYEKDAKQ
uniref:Uncharacterized protein n=1 Tax=Glossina austeni TaxID=7395 RepID=A0A1A9VDV7_GLOAU